jgi:hypothetical protein
VSGRDRVARPEAREPGAERPEFTAFYDEMENVVGLANDGLIDRFVAGFSRTDEAKEPITEDEVLKAMKDHAWLYSNPRIIEHSRLLKDYELMMKWVKDCEKAHEEYEAKNPKPTKPGSAQWDWELKARDSAPPCPRPLSTMIALTAVLSDKALKIEHDRGDVLRVLDPTRAQDRLDDFSDIDRGDEIVFPADEERKAGQEAHAVNKDFARAGLRAHSATIAAQGDGAIGVVVIREAIKFRDVVERNVVAVLLFDDVPVGRVRAGAKKRGSCAETDCLWPIHRRES